MSDERKERKNSRGLESTVSSLSLSLQCLISRKAERIRQGKMVEEEMASDDDDAGWYKQEVGVAPDPGN